MVVQVIVADVEEKVSVIHHAHANQFVISVHHTHGCLLFSFIGSRHDFTGPISSWSFRFYVTKEAAGGTPKGNLKDQPAVFKKIPRR
jgi:hypothetical protein